MERVASTLFVDIAPLRRSPAFARLWAGRGISAVGGQMTIVAVGLHIYSLTSSTLAVALVGVIALGPTILTGLYGGAIADAVDRRLVALLAAVVAWASTGTIALLAWTGLESVGTLYLLTALTAAASTVLSTAEVAVTPRLLPASLLPAASALGGIADGLAITVGPALAGILVAAVGFAWTYSVDVVLFVAALVAIVLLPPIRPESAGARPGLRTILDGLRFLRQAPNIRSGFLIDIVAMLFGQPRVLFPAAAALVLGGGAITVGILTAAFAVGALVCGIFSGRLGSVRLQGRAIGRAVQVYGLFIGAFGLALAAISLLPGRQVDPDALQPAALLPIGTAALLLAGAGAADNVSMVFRNTMLQAAVPDAFRGRLQGIYIVVVSGGPRLGDLYVGLVASLGLLWLPPVVGGILIVTLAGLLLLRARSFASYDALHPAP